MIQRCRAAPKPEEVLHVARRTWQRARCNAGDAEPKTRGGLGHAGDGGGAERAIADDTTADLILADLELGLDHQHEVSIWRCAADQGRQDERQRDE